MPDDVRYNSPPMPTLTDIHTASDRILPHAHRTPVMTSSAIDAATGCELFFKCENFQKVGAFKFRGACNAVMSLADEQAAKGVITHSSGNHAQALALAAKIRGIDAHIIMPSNSPTIKKKAVAGYGAEIYECQPTLESRETTCEEVRSRTGATLVHPYNNEYVIAGQGTCAMELLEEIEQLDAIVAPVGGGGLISGTVIAATPSRLRRIAPRAPVIFGAEPIGADDAARSLRDNKLIPSINPDTIADGLQTSLGSLTWPIIQQHVCAIITVSDEEIIAAMRLIWERMKMIIEPSSATVLAAVLNDAWKSSDQTANLKRIGLILTGGNVDLNHLPWN